MKYTDYFLGEGECCDASDEGHKITLAPRPEPKAIVYENTDDGEIYIVQDGIECCPRKLKEENEKLKEKLEIYDRYCNKDVKCQIEEALNE